MYINDQGYVLLLQTLKRRPNGWATQLPPAAIAESSFNVGYVLITGSIC